MSDTAEHDTEQDAPDLDAFGPSDTSEQREHTRRDVGTDRSFPGGGVRLPRISGSKIRTAPDVLFTDSAFLREPHDARDGAAETGYSQYYSNDSLFEPAGPTAFHSSDGPFEVLGVKASASWEDICRAHRQLVSKLHPDRYIDADEPIREAAERRVRDVNEAFSEIRRRRAPSTR